MRKQVHITSTSEMREFARSIAQQIRSGDLILLNGPLGAGKTFFTQELINSLGVTQPITSPTFVMVKSYRGILPIHHIDAYRLLDLANPKQAFEELDIDIESSLTIVEWGEQFDVTGQGLHITIEIVGDQSRTLTVTGADSRWANLEL
jgi:tRNA threonylcarbamoyladenosine biosynthesis protein TsaE